MAQDGLFERANFTAVTEGTGSCRIGRFSDSRIFVIVGSLGGVTGSARAQCLDGCATEWSGGSIINLRPLPGAPFSQAYSINDAGQAVA